MPCGRPVTVLRRGDYAVETPSVLEGVTSLDGGRWRGASGHAIVGSGSNSGNMLQCGRLTLWANNRRNSALGKT